MIGLGGVFNEAIKAVRFLPVDAHPSVIAEKLMKLRGAMPLRAFRSVEALANGGCWMGSGRFEVAFVGCIEDRSFAQAIS